MSINLAPYRKAVAGALVPAVTLLAADVADGSLPTAHEWLVIALTAVIGGAGVYAAPKNKAK